MADTPRVSHEAPDRAVVTIVYDKHSPDYVVRITEQSDPPDVQLSPLALMPVLAEAMVALIHSADHHGLMGLAEALTRTIEYLEEGTFDAMGTVRDPEPGPG